MSLERNAARSPFFPTCVNEDRPCVSQYIAGPVNSDNSRYAKRLLTHQTSSDHPHWPRSNPTAVGRPILTPPSNPRLITRPRIEIQGKTHNIFLTPSPCPAPAFSPPPTPPQPPAY